MTVDQWVVLSRGRAAAICSLPPRFSLGVLRARGLLLHRERLRGLRLELFYAPLNFINRNARIVVVGITPGWYQTAIAFRAARTALRGGATAREACRLAKFEASFAGPMRKNLVAMLDDLRLPEYLGVSTTATLFETHTDLLHTTSVVCFPTFVDGKNYTGHRPPLLDTPVLRAVAGLLTPELAKIPKALVVPLGKAASQVLEAFIREKQLQRQCCLLGFPHPSGQNGHRVADFRRHLPAMRQTVSDWFQRQR